MRCDFFPANNRIENYACVRNRINRNAMVQTIDKFASKIALVLFYDACVKSHAIIRNEKIVTHPI